jgi:hypothetical protein
MYIFSYILTCLLFFWQVHAIADNNRQLFLNEYHKYAIDLQKQFSNVSYIWKCQQYKLDNTPYMEDHAHVSVSRGRHAVKSTSYRIEITGTKRFGPINYDLRNHFYHVSFEDASKNKRVLTHLEASSAVLFEFCSYSGAYASRLLGDRSYYDLIRAQTTEFISDKSVDYFGVPARCVEIVQAGAGQDGQTERERVKIYFRPDLKWVCCGVQVFSQDESQPGIEERYNYTMMSQDWPDLSGIDCYRFEANENRMFKYKGGPVTNFVRHAEPFPDSTFMLSTYGLPEPAEQFPLDTRFTDPDAGIDPKRYPAPPPASGKGFPWWGWLLAALLLAVGIILIRRSR